MLRAFFNNVIKQFNQDQLRNEITEDKKPLIPPDFFEIDILYLPYCKKNEAKSKASIKKFHEFTNAIILNTNLNGVSYVAP